MTYSIPEGGYHLILPPEDALEYMQRLERERQARDDYRAELDIDDWKDHQAGWDE